MSQPNNLPDNLRSPARSVMGLGSAKSGVDHWWMQRVSAVAVALLGIWFLISLVRFDNFEFVTVTHWIANPCNAALLVLWVSALLYHSKLGVQVVIEDYFRNATKTALIITSSLLHLALAALGTVAVLRIAFGSVA